MDVSIVIPVLNKLEFTRQCLDRIWRNTGDRIEYEVIVVDNASSDGTQEFFTNPGRFPRPVRYVRNAQNLGYAKANNIGARLSQAGQLLFLNNDTLVQPGWLQEMLRVARSNKAIGVVGIKQLFPYTNIIYHTGIVFAPGGVPQHLHPHVDASLPHVNKEREYQAVTGACLMIERALFDACNGFDEAYVNGYEDVDLCMQVRRRGRTIVCCTSAYIYHYGQISEGRTEADDRNAVLFASKWSSEIRIDQDKYLARDHWSGRPAPRPAAKHLAADCIYLADPLDQGSALTWVNAELALALKARGVPVFIHGAPISATVPAPARNQLERLALRGAVTGGVQIKWSHYWPQHLNLELLGDVNLEFFVINYLFGTQTADPWDEWLQCVRQNNNDKLPLSEFCRSVLLRLDVPDSRCHVIHPGYSREIADTEPPPRQGSTFRLLSVTNSHDLNRYGTALIVEAYDRAFSAKDEVVLVLKDYGAAAGNATIREMLTRRAPGAPVEYIAKFTDKRELIRLYKSADAFVSAHRGEGFAMKILDAMACGLPVITPLFGGPADYCTADTCLPVAFSLTPMGDCLDSRSLAITNQPLWAEPDVDSLARQMRAAYEQRERAAAIGARGRASVVDRFSWDQTAQRLLEVANDLRARRETTPRQKPETTSPPTERSPYWLGLRLSVVVPTRNRKEKLLKCLDALTQQSILPQEFEVIVVDDGSTDGTGDALAAVDVPFAVSYYRQDAAGPGAARNLAIAKAAGELVLFIGDDIFADPRLLEEHLLAHAAKPAPGLAILGHIDWPETLPRNAVMEYVCGDAALQFGYTLIPAMSWLDHPFFYTSNISVKRQFLLEAADAGIRFDPDFRRAAFEDSEFASRLLPRGLEIRYAERARAFHDHPMDLDSFGARELAVGEMAVVFYRKHPALRALDVRWLAGLNRPVDALRAEPDFLRRLDAFDAQSDTLLRALAGSLEDLQAIAPRLGGEVRSDVAAGQLRPALDNVLRVIFDVQRTRGKVREWFSNVDDPAKIRAAETLASVRRKIELLDRDAHQAGLLAPLDAHAAGLRERIDALDGGAFSQDRGRPRRLLSGMLRRFGTSPAVLPRLKAADRFLHERLQDHPGSLGLYRRARRRLRALF